MNDERQPGRSAAALSRHVKVKGVRADPGGRVELWALRDGWAVFPDLYATHRRWLWVGAVGCVLFVGSAPILRFGSHSVGTAVAGIAVLLLVVARIADGRATSRAKRLKDQINVEAVARAGGVDSIKWATSMGGRYAQTVGDMNILLNALGRTDPVISATSVTSATVRRHRLHATADIELDGGARVSYRVRGTRAPGRFTTTIAGPLGDRCTVS